MDKETLIYNLERMAEDNNQIDEDEFKSNVRASIAYGMVYAGESFSKSVDGVRSYFTAIVNDVVREMKMVYGMDDNFIIE